MEISLSAPCSSSALPPARTWAPIRSAYAIRRPQHHASLLDNLHDSQLRPRGEHKHRITNVAVSRVTVLSNRCVLPSLPSDPQPRASAHGVT